MSKKIKKTEKNSFWRKQNSLREEEDDRIDISSTKVMMSEEAKERVWKNIETTLAKGRFTYFCDRLERTRYLPFNFL